MKRVECIKKPPLTEYEVNKKYNVYEVRDSGLLQYNVCYEDGSDTSFSPSQIEEYFIFI